jgi:hypothetical protein
MKDGLSDEQLITRIKESYLRSLRANFEHHDALSNALGEGRELKSAKRHTLFANVYLALAGEIPPDSTRSSN